MKERVVRAIVFATIAAAAGAAVVFWQHLDHKVTIVLTLAVIGFLLGLVFKLRAV